MRRAARLAAFTTPNTMNHAFSNSANSRVSTTSAEVIASSEVTRAFQRLDTATMTLSDSIQVLVDCLENGGVLIPDAPTKEMLCTGEPECGSRVAQHIQHHATQASNFNDRISALIERLAV